MPVFALCDANNFYASCERVFNPALENRPVAVLSNNDGCIIARSNEVKALGIPMGAPWHQYKALCAQHQVTVFSSNYALYGDMSARVMRCLATFTPNIEIYSIDEAFLLLNGFESSHLVRYAEEMRQIVRQWTGIPISVGIGPTKTLAKIANLIAKKRTTSGVFDLCDRTGQDHVLPTITVGEIWGIGRRWAAKLKGLGIHTAADLREAKPAVIRQELNVVGEHIVHELRGIACLELEAIEPKKTLMVSRSFRHLVIAEPILLEAISAYAARASEKLRQQRSHCGGLSVFLQTNQFRPSPQYKNSCVWSFDCVTNDTREIMHAARRCLSALFKPGFEYHKCGVMLLDIAPDTFIQNNLFQPKDHQRCDALMATIDRINQRMGSGTLRFAAQGMRGDWQMKQQWRSPRYTTRLKELPKVKCQ
jgi:DNA polymerase V